MNLTCIGFLFAFSCQPATPPIAAIPYCQVARPIHVSRHDTPETIRLASIELRKWKRLCGGDGP